MFSKTNNKELDNIIKDTESKIIKLPQWEIFTIGEFLPDNLKLEFKSYVAQLIYNRITPFADGISGGKYFYDELPLEKRIKERWDRIATVEKNGIETEFHTFDSPSKSVRINQPIFRYGCFIYTDTEKYLTVVAENKEEYHKKFKNAGECMAYVSEIRRINKKECNDE